MVGCRSGEVCSLVICQCQGRATSLLCAEVWGSTRYIQETFLREVKSLVPDVGRKFTETNVSRTIGFPFTEELGIDHCIPMLQYAYSMKE